MTQDVKDRPSVSDPESSLAGRLGFLTVGACAVAALLTTPPAKMTTHPDAIAEDPLLAVLESRAGVSAASSAADSFVSEMALRWGVPREEVLQYMEHAFRASEKFGVDPLLIMSVISVESGWRAAAVNDRSGAEGLMQVHRRFHLDKAERYGVSADSPMTPEQNINVGTAVLREYLDRAQQRLPAESQAGKSAMSAWLDHTLLAYSGNRDNPGSRYPAKVKEAYTQLASRVSALSGAEALDAQAVDRLRNGVKQLHVASNSNHSRVTVR